MVSKAAVVTKSTRIGDKVGIYEISEKEAVDIDSFEDLVCAEQILKEKRIAIIVNGNNHIGLGHISRALELADMFYNKPDIYYARELKDFKYPIKNNSSVCFMVFL